MSTQTVVISKNNCPQCTWTMRELTRLNIDFAIRKIEEDPEALALVRKLGHSSMPVVIRDETHWSGFQPDRIKELAA